MNNRSLEAMGSQHLAESELKKKDRYITALQTIIDMLRKQLAKADELIGSHCNHPWHTNALRDELLTNCPICSTHKEDKQ